jgi:hypothetical protein
MDRRKQDRKYLTFFSRVTDRVTGRMIGYLVDLTTGGALLIGDIALEKNKILHLQIDLPLELAEIETLDLEVRTVWSQPDPDPELFRTGLQLLDVTPENLAILEKLLSNYSSNER